MKKVMLAAFVVLALFPGSKAQSPATIKEYTKVFTTYPFSDPNPIPVVEKIYPYFRYDGFTTKPVQKEWKVVELENDYLRVMILPEIGGKIWSAVEKSTGKSFVYYNHTVKFRDVAMRGPWTSGGIEPNYGIIGHTPNCATPVDYMMMKKDDGSVSCVIGVLDLLTRTPWRLEINLPKDKAYLSTRSFWYNATPFEQPYYTWMNTGLKSKGNLEFIYPGTHYLGHSGEYSDWPVNKQNGKDISFYENNNFGGYKSYHVFGKYTDFFGAYWHDEDFGMGRYSTHDEKAGKKIWIWGLSAQGMIWEKLLTDTDGQYVEVQSGRLFNQADVGSTFTPFKHTGFSPYEGDTWTEYWFPVKDTKGFVKANNYGALNIKNQDGWLKIYFMPLQNINQDLKVMVDNKVIYTKPLHLDPMHVFTDSVRVSQNTGNPVVTLGENNLVYDASPTADVLDRPLESPANFDWNSVFGLYIQGKENIRQMFYDKGEEKLQACLQKDPNYVPALTDMAMLMCRNMRYPEAYIYAWKALSIDTYDPSANYYYGLANEQLGNIPNAKDGFDIAALSIEYRSASYTQLSKIYFKEGNYQKAEDFAFKSLQFNRYNLEAYQVMAMIDRLQKNQVKEQEVLSQVLAIDPLNHFARFEKFLMDNSDESKRQFLSLIKNELPHETFLELATWYYNLGQNDACETLLGLAPQAPEVLYWLAFLKGPGAEGQALFQKARNSSPLLSFPFRMESVPILEWAAQNDVDWKPKYYLALIYWHANNLTKAKELFRQCGGAPEYAPFYAARANLWGDSSKQKLADLQHAIDLDKEEWRFPKMMAEYRIRQNQYPEALAVAEPYYKLHPGNYVIGMLYAKTLLLNNRYKEGDALLARLNIIPFEGATDGRELYREAKLMQAVQEIKKKNFKMALQFIDASKLWPVNLGVGKPYDEDIDLRLEEWMSYICYQQMGKRDLAQAALHRILLKANSSPQANSLVTAWAMEKLDQKKEALQWLNRLIQQYPGNKILLWSLAMFEGQKADALLGGDKMASVRILEQLAQL